MDIILALDPGDVNENTEKNPVVNFRPRTFLSVA